MGSVTEDEGSSDTFISPGKDSLPTNNVEYYCPENSLIRSDSGDRESHDTIEATSKTPQQQDPFIVENFDENLPPTVTLLTTPDGVKVYLVGTAHYGVESQDDVSTVIRNVRPHVVMAEICEVRAQFLQMDGWSSWLMIEGGEFRRALAEVKMLPNCVVHYGDRPIDLTLIRLFSALSWWQGLRLVVAYAFIIIIFFIRTPTKEEVERMKQKEEMERLLKMMKEYFPGMYQVVVEERDVYLTYYLQQAARNRPPGVELAERTRVVGIVGMLHVAGITRLWGTVKYEDILHLHEIPPPTRTGWVVKATVKVCVVGLAAWGAYKYLAPKVLTDIVNL